MRGEKVIVSKQEETFEDLIRRLEEITDTLEKGQISLDDSMKLFEEGMKISKKCSSKLEEAENKITILINENNNLREENFTPEEE